MAKHHFPHFNTIASDLKILAFKIRHPTLFQKEIARRLGIHRHHVANALRRKSQYETFYAEQLESYTKLHTESLEVQKSNALE